MSTLIKNMVEEAVGRGWLFSSGICLGNGNRTAAPMKRSLCPM